MSARRRWLTLIAALLGWGIDGIEMGVFPVVAQPALFDLLATPNEQSIRNWNAVLTISFLLGAAVGGVAFGWLGDRIGRIRALAVTVLTYSLITGLTAFSQSAWQLVAGRFMAATGMGGEWALGLALVVESWPESARPWLAGLIGAAVNLGYVFVALLAARIDPTNWRLILFCCAAPALLTFFIRFAVPESPKWQAASPSTMDRLTLRRRRLLGSAAAGVYILAVWGAVQFTQLWAVQMFSDPRAAISVQLISAGYAALGALLAPVILVQVSRRRAYAGLCAAALIMSIALFFGVSDFGIRLLFCVAVLGLITGGIGGWLALYLPELFPTAIRAMNQGICYNVGRVAAAGGVALTAFAFAGEANYPIYCGTVSLVYIFGIAIAFYLPETRGTSLT